jgi:hypothetical protein
MKGVVSLANQAEIILLQKYNHLFISVLFALKYLDKLGQCHKNLLGITDTLRLISRSVC